MRRAIFVFGGPGSGKGTGCATIAKKFGLLHLSAGELLRQELENESGKYQPVIKGHIDAGTIVPGYITAALLMDEIKASLGMGVLIDGFPRNPDNFQAWSEANAAGEVESSSAIHFVCSEEIMLARITRRARTDDNITAF
jgi:UMP-CMP kinase